MGLICVCWSEERSSCLVILFNCLSEFMRRCPCMRMWWEDGSVVWFWVEGSAVWSWANAAAPANPRVRKPVSAMVQNLLLIRVFPPDMDENLVKCADCTPAHLL